MATSSSWFHDEEQLLRELQDGDWESGAVSTGAPAADDGEPPRFPERIGRYAVTRVIASGGMGTVYEAIQEQPHRSVAVKVLRHGVASRSAMRRFAYESEVLAKLRHPGIAQVYESGTHDDGTGVVPFFAMEFVPDAKPITAYAREKQLSTRDRLELFTRVCEAVHHGHLKGVIHRDLKPSNILVDGDGQVKVIDFGVARGTDCDVAMTTLRTGLGRLVGTLQYMSPEQCTADPDDLDTRCDVYSLGVVLFEVLSGQLPYDVGKRPVLESTRVIREQQPSRLSAVVAALKGDIETIVVKALEKEPQRRYSSAAELAGDIQRFLRGEAILARAPSLAYQVRVFARRNRMAFGAMATLMVVLVAGITISAWQALRATRAERLAEQRLVDAERQASIAEAVNAFLNDDLLASVDPSRTPDREITMREVLDAASERIAGEFVGEPLVEASIRATIGRTYLTLGDLEAAQPHLTAAEAIHAKRLGDDDVVTLRTRTQLGKLLSARGRFPASEALLRTTVRRQRRILGDVHPDTVAAINLLGHVLTQQGNYRAAEPLLREALKTEPTFATLNNLANVLGRRGKYVKAESYYRQTLALQEPVLGTEHPDTLQVMNNLGIALWFQSRNQEAEEVFRQTLEIERRVLGDEHPETLKTMGNLGLILRNQCHYAESEEVFVDLLEVQRRVLGEDHRDALATMSNLSAVLLDEGKYAEAELFCRDTLERQRRVLGGDHPDALATMHNLVNLLRAHGRICEVEPLIEVLLDHRRAAAERRDAGPRELNDYAWLLLTCHPPSNRDVAGGLAVIQKAIKRSGGKNLRSQFLLAIGRLVSDDPSAACEVFKEAMASLSPDESWIRTQLETGLVFALGRNGLEEDAAGLREQIRLRVSQSHGERQAELVERMTSMALMLLERGDYDLFGGFCGAVAQARRGIVPQDGSGAAHLIVAFAVSLVHEGRFGEAEPLLRACVEIRKLAHDEGDWRIADVQRVLGASLTGSKRYPQAEPLLRDAYVQLRDGPTAPSDSVRQTIEHLIALYDALGDPTEATVWRELLAKHPSDSTGD